MFENPTKKRSKKASKKASKRKKRSKNLYVPKRKLRKGTSVKPRRKKRSMAGANAILPTQTTQGARRKSRKGTVGKRKYSRKGTVGRRRTTTSGVTMGARRKSRKGTVGRRRTTKGTMGFLNFKNIFDELLSAGSVALGGLGGLVASSYVTSSLFGKTDAATGNTTITYSDSILGGLVSFGVLHLAENYIRPNGMAGNIFTGAKVFSIFSVLMKLKGLFIDGKEWAEADYTLPKDSDIIGARVPKTLMGVGAYLVEDDASVINLGSNKITSTMLGANKIMPNTMLGAGRSEINEAVNNLMTMHGASTKNTFESAFRPA
jgi:hypothetical protein